MAGALVVIATAVLLLRQMQRGTPAQRRVLAPLAAYGIFALLLFPVSTWVATTWFGGGGLWLPAAELILISFVPLAFLAAASRGGSAPRARWPKGAWLGSDEGGRPELRDALADALGDPSVELLFCVPGEEGWSASPASPRSSAAAASADAASRRGRARRARVGAIVYDATLLDRPARCARPAGSSRSRSTASG